MKSKYIKGISIEQKYKTANKVLSAVGLFVLVIAVGVFVVYNPAFIRHNFVVIITFFINITLFISQLIASTSERSFSFRAMFWIFNLFFFGLAPFYQYVSGSSVWGIKSSDNDFLISNVYILFWSALYICGYKLHFNNQKNKMKIRKPSLILDKEAPQYEYQIRRNALNVMLLFSVLIVFYYLTVVGAENMFLRSTSGNEVIADSTPLKLLELHVLKNTVVFTTALHIADAKQRKFVSAQLIIAIACLLICCFPTSLSRYNMAAIYTGIMIISFNKTRKGRWFMVRFVLALVVIFPAIDIFRNLDTLREATDFGATIRKEIKGIYTTGDYDTYSMFINVRRYVNFFGHSFGNQLLGALLFFVPRSFWASKAVGTGHTVFLALHPEFTNVSAPLISEGYMDFGVVGIVVYGILTGAITQLLDKRYWTSSSPLSKERIIYPFLIFQFFFLLRGDMMSGGAYLIAKYVMGTLIYLAVVKKTPKVNKLK